MTRVRCALLFFLTVSYCTAQIPQHGGPALPRYQPTPAQSDWLEQMNNSDRFDELSAAGPAAALPPGKSVSVVRLRHKPPGKAMASFSRGLKLVTHGALQQGAREFERAVMLDPNFSEAYGDLGATYSAQGLYAQAVVEFQRAIEIDPATAVHHMNLAYVLIRLKRDKEAEPEAQTAVTLDPANATAHYLLGFLFAQRPEMRERAIEQLTYAGRELPEAHLLLSEMYRFEGAGSAASQEFEWYRKAIGAQPTAGNHAASDMGFRLK
jgi:tetratricopeptide (TPR) repeat protein